MSYSPDEQPSQSGQSGMTRRSFTAAAVAAATVVLIKPAEALQAEKSPVQPATALAQQADAAMAKLSPGAQAEAEMKVNSIFRKYGNRLNDEQKADIRKVMAETQSGLEKMRAFPLENGDLPATIFRAEQGSEKK
jgi:hypothetical protein